ncbi:MAG: acyl-CoA thioesterase II [Novosphingobium sp. 32-60-15]|uniref:acyl-CoA thioesterase n=1 Tax=unclassified Novosphingobium TaxID=2644732 RepID=UPI000BC62654|nr:MULTISPECIES: acyl-CoA thioesterase II [unclassified Novosphingobium]OYX62444.1 MAG: acyl-CoA thioesterase II [Novosphingobium sp. 32-60-15]
MPPNKLAGEIGAANPFPDDPDLERHAAYEFDRTGPDRFQSRPLPSGLLRLFGGLIVSQALAAMQQTVPDDKFAHAIHVFYQRAGLIDRPLHFAIERDTDGRSFAQRRVSVTQDGQPIAYAMASFQTAEAGGVHQDAMPNVAGPEELEPLASILTRRLADLPLRHRPFWCRRQQFDWRPVEEFCIGNADIRPARRHFWLRANAVVEAPLPVHQRLLAYASDTHIMQTGLRPLGLCWTDDHLQTSSLDHAIWFHAPFRVDDWLLYVIDSPVASGARVLGTGTVFKRDGTLVATVVQQGLARRLDEKREGKI